MKFRVSFIAVAMFARLLSSAGQVSADGCLGLGLQNAVGQPVFLSPAPATIIPTQAEIMAVPQPRAGTGLVTYPVELVRYQMNLDPSVRVLKIARGKLMP